MTVLDLAPTTHPAPPRTGRPDTVLAIEGLSVTVDPKGRPLQLISDVNISVGRGECVGVVGESGCGKTVSFLAALGLMPSGTQVDGKVTLGGEPLLGLSEKELEAKRGRRVGMIFQDPQSALNPVLTIGRQLVEPLQLHLGLTQRQARERAIELLSLVGIPDPAARLMAYPHQISGGMCQRVMIAIALASEPEVLIADEPTTALDATVQLQVLDLLKSIQQRSELAIVLITHDLGVIGRACDRVSVMYAGRTVETRAIPDIFHSPWHPYTAALLDCLPRADGSMPRSILGEVPTPGATPSGCAYHPRCDIALTNCSTERPPMRLADGGGCACHTPLRSLRR